ncbi:MAG: ribose 5-phosphate isomerase A [Gemmatimonadota bacterium]
MDNAEALKRAAAARALDLVESGMVLGLGTGSTMAHFLDLLGERIGSGALTGIRGVPSSVRTRKRARELDIPLTNLADQPRLDLAVDGADEVSPEVDLIKGMGGALLREKMVAQASERFVIIADDSKAVERLGTRSPLPVEVATWEWASHVPFLEGLGARATLRRGEDGEPYRTDNGNVILDCIFARGIADPHALNAVLEARAGVVETGLFLAMAAQAFLAGPEGIREVRRKP